MPFQKKPVSEDITLIQEIGLPWYMSCNVWHVRGRDCDLIVDTSVGLSSLKAEVEKISSRPIVAVLTHTHFDHCGSLHEFEMRLGHHGEASVMENPTHSATYYSEDWADPRRIDKEFHPEFDPKSFQITPAPLTQQLQAGDIIDLGDKTFEVLHTPGHSPGSISLWDAASRTLFSGDAVYDGPMIDDLLHSNPADFVQSLESIVERAPLTVHPGHFGSFGPMELKMIVDKFQSRDLRKHGLEPI